MEIHDMNVRIVGAAGWPPGNGRIRTDHSTGWDSLRFDRAVRAASRPPLRLLLILLPALSLAAVPDGYVVKMESSTVYLDWGKSSGVQVGDSFALYRLGETLKHPVTGEVLGQPEENLGQGVIERVEEKFSLGKMLGVQGAARAGDRTRRRESAPPASAAASGPAAATAMAAGGGETPRELWRSESLGRFATGLAIGDVDGDGKKEVVVSFRDRIEVYRWTGQKLESIAKFKPRGSGNFLAVETTDLDGLGHDRIFASLYTEGIHRSRTDVLEWSTGSLREIGHLQGFVRAFERWDGKRPLLWQDMSLARELRIRTPEFVIKSARGYAAEGRVKLARQLNDDQLFGYAWGDWDGDGAEDFAFLQGGERVRILFKDAKWSSREAYGGTNADFSWEGDQIGSVIPRLLTWKRAAGKPMLLVPHNIQFTPIRLTHLKIYKNSELLGLAWNGLEMAPVWTLPVSGELADFGLGDAMGRGTPQLWMAAVGAGDKTILLAYQLP
jgi:hypothetical protein